jgi:hypothetical protein
MNGRRRGLGVKGGIGRGGRSLPEVPWGGDVEDVSMRTGLRRVGDRTRRRRGGRPKSVARQLRLPVSICGVAMIVARSPVTVAWRRKRRTTEIDGSGRQ